MVDGSGGVRAITCHTDPVGDTDRVIDCEGLEYVSSAGLRVFLLAARNAQRAGLNFSVCALQNAVREVFELSGFSRVMAVHPDRAAALTAAAQKPA